MGNPRGFPAAVFAAVLCALTQRQRECFTLGNFPGGPVAKTLLSQRRGPRFNPWSWN